MNAVEYNGHRFVEDKNTGYYLSSFKIDGKRRRLHRYVWETHNGDIPDGMFVHHVDGDKSNNGIENLALMDGGKHSSYHTKKRIAENPEAYRKRFLAATQDLAKEWHKSEEGRLWHSKHAMDNSSFIDRTEDAICVVCGAHYKVTKVRKNKAMFCSGRCKAKHYRDTHRYAQVNRGTA